MSKLIGKSFVREFNGAIEAYKITQVEDISSESGPLFRFYGKQYPSLKNELFVSASGSPDALGSPCWKPFTSENLNKCVEDAKESVEWNADRLQCYTEEERDETVAVAIEVTGRDYSVTNIVE